MTKLEDFLQTLHQVKTSDLVSYLCTGHDMHNNSIIARVVDDAYTIPDPDLLARASAPLKKLVAAMTAGRHQDALGRVIRSLSPTEENDVRAAIAAVAAEVDRRIPAEEESRA